MLFLLTTLALAQDITTEAIETDTVFLESATEADVQDVAIEGLETAPGYSFLISKRDALALADEEVAWGEVTAELATSIVVEFQSDVVEDLQIAVTPTDKDGFAIGEPQLFDIQAALGTGTRSTATQAGGKTELL